MDQKFLTKFGVMIILASLSTLILVLMIDHVSPQASVNARLSRGEIMDRAGSYLMGLGYDLKDYQQDSWFGFEGATHLFLQERHGMHGANDLIKSELVPAHNWFVSWYDRKSSTSQNPETYHVWLAPSGRILGFEHIIDDSVRMVSLDAESARLLAEKFLKSQRLDLSQFHLRNSAEVKQTGRKDYRFVWAKGDSIAEEDIWAHVQGNEMAGFRWEYKPGSAFQKAFSQSLTTWTLVGTASSATMFFLFFLIIILFLKKYHEGEVGIKTATLIFAGLFLAFLLAALNSYPAIGSTWRIGDMNQFNTRIVVFVMSVFILQAFLCAMVFAAWSVGESNTRSTWSVKLLAVDSLLFRRFFTLPIAEGILRGYLAGLTMLGGYAVLVYMFIQYLGIHVYPRMDPAVDSYIPGLQPLFTGAGTAILAEIVYRLFFLSYMKERFRKTWVAVVVSTLVWTLAGSTFWEVPFGFLTIGTYGVVMSLFGLTFCWLFLHYDLLTTITANFVISAVVAAIPIFESSGSFFHAAQWETAVLLLLPLAVAAVGFIRKEQFEFTPSTLPDHIRRISERERMAKELEIARNVQMSLLPKVNPVLDGYEIAGICIPALEVGGDYYDFVTLAGGKVGIAIGDVSGKGVPAAIYMTLTKGILQSQAEENASPRKVLSKVNNLMYRTIERNSFVSMFYAVLDVKKRTILFSRAGQCPVILAHRSGKKGTFLSPQGLALGLERGKVFDRVLEEKEIKLASGEVLVFYTDGFTEAMNGEGEEYGEKRLVDAVARHRQKSANGLIKGICDDVSSFTGSRPQHDDMTMVVVKVD